MGCIASDWHGGRLGGDDFAVDTWVYWNLGAVFAGASDFVFCGGSPLVDAEAGLGGGRNGVCSVTRDEKTLNERVK